MAPVSMVHTETEDIKKSNNPVIPISMVDTMLLVCTGLDRYSQYILVQTVSVPSIHTDASFALE